MPSLIGQGTADRQLRVRIPDAPIGSQIPKEVSDWMAAVVRNLALADEIRQQPLARGYTISGTYTDTRSLNFDTATLDNLLAFVCTLVTDLKKGGILAG